LDVLDLDLHNTRKEVLNRVLFRAYMRALFTIVTTLLCQYTNSGGLGVKDSEVHTVFDALKFYYK
jgi:hypothetical protein